MRVFLAAILLAVVPPAGFAQSSTALDLFNRARAGSAEAVVQLRKAAESGDPESQFQLGRAYSHGASIPRDDAAAVRWVEQAATQGHVEAQSNLGYMYSAGLGVARDSDKAILWWTKAAESGFVQAQYNLAVAYLEGKLVAKDERKGFDWMKRAAMQGVPLAQLNLGMLHGRGTGTERSSEEAAAWYRKAAEQGNETAMLNLAAMHATGEGVSRDPDEALRWLRRPLSTGNPRAAAMRTQLCREYPRACETEPVAAHFEFEMTDPKLRIVIPDAPPMQMGPHPLRQAHTRFMGGGPKGFTISVLVPTADQGTTPLECARSGSSSIARRFGVNPVDVVTRRTNDATFVMLFPLKMGALVQLKAFLLTGYRGTHCVEVHLSRTLEPGAAAEAELAAWKNGFHKARIEAY